MRIGPRNDYIYTGSNIITCDGCKLPWSNEIRYLGTYIVQLQSRLFKCSFDMQKNRSSVHSTLYLVKLVEMHRKKSSWS